METRMSSAENGWGSDKTGLKTEDLSLTDLDFAKEVLSSWGESMGCLEKVDECWWMIPRLESGDIRRWIDLESGMRTGEPGTGVGFNVGDEGIASESLSCLGRWITRSDILRGLRLWAKTNDIRQASNTDCVQICWIQGWLVLGLSARKRTDLHWWVWLLADSQRTRVCLQGWWVGVQVGFFVLTLWFLLKTWVWLRLTSNRSSQTWSDFYQTSGWPCVSDWVLVADLTFVQFLWFPLLASALTFGSQSSPRSDLLGIWSDLRSNFIRGAGRPHTRLDHCNCQQSKSDKGCMRCSQLECVETDKESFSQKWLNVCKFEVCVYVRVFVCVCVRISMCVCTDGCVPFVFSTWWTPHN
jgi:hypothetical protein